MVYGPNKNYEQVIHLKLNPANTTADNLRSIEKIFKKYNPQYPFESTFVDADYSKNLPTFSVRKSWQSCLRG